MRLTESELVASCHQFELDLDGVRFWTPYWLNVDRVPFHINAPLRGKGDAAGLMAELRRVVDETTVVPTAAGLRQLMFQHGLGIDCSGFVYHVLEAVLAPHGIRVADGLTVSRTYVQGALERFPERMRPELEGPLPEELSLGHICDLWGKLPADLTGVRRFTRASAPVDAVSKARPGDFIVWLGADDTRPGDDHIGIVASVTDDKLTYWSSDHDVSGPGGVGAHELTITDGRKGPAEQAEWPEVAGRGPSLWRFKLLAE